MGPSGRRPAGRSKGFSEMQVAIIYLDMNVYNRPFDDQGQMRIRLETMRSHSRNPLWERDDRLVQQGQRLKEREVLSLSVINPIDLVREV